MITQACAVATAEVMNDFSHRQTPIVDDCVLFDTGADRASYPSIPGEHKGNFTPRKDIKIEKVYTCPCPGTALFFKAYWIISLSVAPVMSISLA